MAQLNAKAILFIVVYTSIMHMSNGQYFSAAQRGNIPRLGKRPDMMLADTMYSRPLLYSNQEINAASLPGFTNQNLRTEDDMWLKRVNRIKSSQLANNYALVARQHISEIEAIENSLVSLISSINIYKKNFFDEISK